MINGVYSKCDILPDTLNEKKMHQVNGTYYCTLTLTFICPMLNGVFRQQKNPYEVMALIYLK